MKHFSNSRPIDPRIVIISMSGLLQAVALLLCLANCLSAQAPLEKPTPTAGPRLVRFAGSVPTPPGAQATGAVGAIFGVYKDEQGGSPLWTEAQNLEPAADGKYSVLLGATSNEGLPSEIFAAGESRWLQVEFQLPGQTAQPRVLLVSVPYALKAADAETLGGKPASAFRLAWPAASSASVDAASSGGGSTLLAVPPAPLANSGTANYLGKFLNSTDLTSSSVYDNGNVGIGTANPVYQFEVYSTAEAPTARFAGTSLTYGPQFVLDATQAGGSEFRLVSTPQYGPAGANRFAIWEAAHGYLMTVTNTGNVGIGTTAPKANLEVNGNAQVDGNLMVTGSLVGAGSSGPVLLAPAASSNLSVGVGAMPATAGGQNTAAGDNALHASTTGSFNSAFGYGALLVDTSGGLNTAVGNAALYNNTTGSNNTAVGGDALIYNNGSNNTAVGELALYSNAGGSNNTAVGQGALYSNITSGNTAVGQNAMNANTTGAQNTAVGTSALAANTGASYNVALGFDALLSNTFGGLNTAIGNAALLYNTVGANNTAVGADALLYNNGSNNTAVGELALYDNTSGIDNTAVGAGALNSNGSASNNVAVGQAALKGNVTGTLNTALGSQALTNSSGDNNTGLGYGAASLLAIGSANTAVGSFALGNAAITNNNTAIGYSALNGAYGGNNIAIGHLAGSNITSANNTISIGSAGVNVNGAVSIGDNATSFTANGTVYFPFLGTFGPSGSSLPVYVLSTTGQLFYELSSRRYKDDIRDMGEASSGLSRLRPVTFHYKKGSPVGPEQLQYGLIAEEVAAIFPEIVVWNGNGQPETLDYSKLTPMLVNEVQKLNTKVAAQQDKLRTQEQQISSLAERLAEVEAALERVAAVGGRQR